MKYQWTPHSHSCSVSFAIVGDDCAILPSTNTFRPFPWP